MPRNLFEENPPKNELNSRTEMVKNSGREGNSEMHTYMCQNSEGKETEIFSPSRTKNTQRDIATEIVLDSCLLGHKVCLTIEMQKDGAGGEHKENGFWGGFKFSSVA